jgi:MYXO-CTERM domain-containing protein
MRPHRVWPAALATAALAMASCAQPTASSVPPTIVGHPIRVDASRKLLPWADVDAPYAHVARLAWTALETKFPAQDNGLPTYLAYSRFDPEDQSGVSWPHNPAGLYAMLADSAVLWYAFSGDHAAVDLVRRALDQQLDHGTTPADWDWARVPYASANAGDVDYRGADDEWCDFCGRGDGAGVIEPDKVGELGFGYLQFFELTGEGRYREAAIACADALAAHAREGDEERSPWPFRVYAQTNVTREEYSANVVGAIQLFDELGRLGLGDVDAYARARSVALEWMLRVPMKNDAWSGYFEDIDVQTEPSSNPNQYAAMAAARWLMRHPEADPQWRDDVLHLLAWVVQTFGGDTASERGTQWGATVLSEQSVDMAKMGSHTARFGATTALWAEATGDLTARDRAARSLAWATYACDEDGIVAVGEDRNEGWWFSDGYGDYIRHFLVAMGAEPEWAPSDEGHVLRSTSIVTSVDYAPGRIAWSTFDADAVETLRLPARPDSVTVGDDALAERADLDDEGWVAQPLASGGFVVHVRHHAPANVVVTTGAQATGTSPAVDSFRSVAGTGCSAGGAGGPEGIGWLAGVVALAGLRRRRRH